MMTAGTTMTSRVQEVAQQLGLVPGVDVVVEGEVGQGRNGGVAVPAVSSYGRSEVNTAQARGNSHTTLMADEEAVQDAAPPVVVATEPSSAPVPLRRPTLMRVPPGGRGPGRRWMGTDGDHQQDHRDGRAEADTAGLTDDVVGDEDREQLQAVEAPC